MRTPEQRAEMLYLAGALSDTPPCVKWMVAEEIRAAENAALERAASACLRCTVGFYPTRADLRPAFAEQVRALKTRAPRARRKA